jgi:hypothetical protein
MGKVPGRAVLELPHCLAHVYKPAHKQPPGACLALSSSPWQLLFGQNSGASSTKPIWLLGELSGRVVQFLLKLLDWWATIWGEQYNFYLVVGRSFWACSASFPLLSPRLLPFVERFGGRSARAAAIQQVREGWGSHWRWSRGTQKDVGVVSRCRCICAHVMSVSAQHCAACDQLSVY